MAAKTLEKLSKAELYERAQEADVPGRSDMSKDELVDALSECAFIPVGAAITVLINTTFRCET